MVLDLVWNEKYRPQTVEECILPERLKTFFGGMVERKELQGYTAFGSAGSGKTSCSKALCKSLGYDYLLINASEDRNIDTVRTTIRDYGSSRSLMSDMKCVILDEADALAPASQNALRSMIEEFAGTCRFILTANFPNKIIDPLLSRCPLVDFTYSKTEKSELVVQFGKRLKKILDAEKIEYDIDQVMTLVLRYFPDFRKIINLVQRYSVTGTLKISNVQALEDDAVDALLGMLKNREFSKMRKWVAENFDIDGSQLRRHLYDRGFHVFSPECVPEIILLLAQYDYKESFVADREINTVAMLSEIMATAQFKEK